MTLVGILCIAIGLALSFGLSVSLKSPLCVLLFLYHTAASFLYWLYSLQASADAGGYYAAPYDPHAEIRAGTRFVTWLTVWLRESLDASYLDLFMLFQVAGYIGVIVFYQLCRRMVHGAQNMDDSPPSYLIAVITFLPGLHVWTSAIGKDGLVFLGICCFLWGAAQRGAGLAAMLAGLALCALIRPHIAALLAGSCAASLALSSGVRIHWRLTVLFLLLAALWFGLPYLQEFLKVEELNSSNMIDYIEERQDHNLGGGSSISIADYSLPFQIFTFMYRPLFFDANGMLGLVVSFENLFYLGISAFYLPRVAGLLLKGDNTFFLRFNGLYWVLGTIIMASTTANLGLAIRQKMMLVPSLILISLAVHAKERRKSWQTQTGEVQHVSPI